MTESSKSRVTITLGRSGQVVKRTGAELESAFSDSHPSVGNKRSIRDRLENIVDSVQLKNKRQREDNDRLHSSFTDGVDDLHLGKGDLRYIIMRKNRHEKTLSDGQQNGVDLREMLSRPAKPSTSLGVQQLLPVQKNSRQHLPDRNEVRRVVPEVRDDRQGIPETRDGRQRMPVMRDDKQHMPETRDGRQRMLETETRDGRQRIPETRDGRQQISETREGRQHLSETRDGRHLLPDMRDGRQRIPEMRDGRQLIPEMRDGMQRMPEMRDGMQRMPEMTNTNPQMPEMRDARQHIPEARDIRQHMPEARDLRQHMPEARDVRQRMPEPTSVSLLGGIPSIRSVDALPQMDSVKNLCAPWTLDRLRRRSPDGVLRTSRVVSPPRNEEESRRRALIRAYDDERTITYTSKDGLGLSRPMGTASYMAKPALVAAPAKPVPPLLAPPPLVDEHHSVDGLLLSLGLGKYIINFKAEEVDMAALRQMGDIDLKELGIPMGPRKKIHQALMSRSRRQE